MKQVTTIGVDLAKSVFKAHGVDVAGHVVLRKTVPRERLIVDRLAGRSIRSGAGRRPSAT